MSLKYPLLILLASFIISCSSSSQEKFSFQNTPDGVEVLEGGKPVLFYQKTTKTPNGEFFLNNYIHPLYSLEGDTLTEEFPKDHLHHRGIFWAWHQIYIDTLSVGDGWIMENVSTDVVSVKTNTINGTVQIITNVLWKSKNFNNQDPFIEEHTTITVHEVQDNFRSIDFEIKLKALVPEVYIGGSDNEKGYGGFSPRIKLPDNLVFTSESGKVVPQNLQIKDGRWMDFSGSFGKTKQSGLTILCHPSTPNYVAPWILRQNNSMQNIVFPGQEKVSISMENPLVLRYRLIIHNGNASSIDIDKLQLEYEKVRY